MIRPATESDIDTLVHLAEVMHYESDYKVLPFNGEKVAKMMRALLDGYGVVFVAEKAGSVVGAIAGGVDDFWFADASHAYELGLFVLPDHRGGSAAIRLLAAFEHWAKGRGATWIDLGITTGVHAEKTAGLYKKLGYAESGKLFRKGVENV